MISDLQFGNIRSHSCHLFAGAVNRIMELYEGRCLALGLPTLSCLLVSLALEALDSNNPSSCPAALIDSPDHIEMHNVSIRVPSGKALVHGLSFDVRRGQSMLICGPTGIGKSSIVRTLSGVWPGEGGWIARPSGVGRDGFFVLPQQPYLTIGTLVEQITYPEAAPLAGGRLSPMQRAYFVDLLGAVDLAHLESTHGLLTAMRWDNVLSTGEQQRLCFLRVLHHRPSAVVLDEATSALDSARLDRLYAYLSRLGAAVLSIGPLSHARYHQSVIVINADGSWSQRAGSAEPIERSQLSDWPAAPASTADEVEPPTTLASVNASSDFKEDESKASQSLYSLRFVRKLWQLIKIVNAGWLSKVLFVVCFGASIGFGYLGNVLVPYSSQLQTTGLDVRSYFIILLWTTLFGILMTLLYMAQSALLQFYLQLRWVPLYGDPVWSWL